MSQSFQPPGNPFAGGPVPPGPGNPFAPAPPVRDNVGLGLGAAAVTAIAAAAIYGGIAGAIESEIGFAAIAVGFVIGLVAGKVGGRNPILAVASAVFALAAVYLGQIFGIAIIGAEELGLSTTEMLFDHFSLLTEAWNQGKEAMTFLFFALAAFAAVSAAKKA
ncbi:hypothetical protein [Streptomyces sp. NBC_01716]|uniref:hypothetical protein n=1 Tax=Streptomyces sp. NBC_01716 TaxID=2975917 RepID=UPI002E3365DD|nr:hypothetical protein [Streptomyces sp. NBC_01716]